MTASKSTISAVESAIRAVSSELVKHSKAIGTRASRKDALYELRQTLLMLAKTRTSFEGSSRVADANAEPIGFDVSGDDYDDEDDGPDVDVPAARVAPRAKLIGFTPPRS